MSKFYLHDIAYELGQPAPVEGLAELKADPPVLETFLALGLKSYARSTLEPAALALASAKRTIAAANLRPGQIDAVVYASNTFAAPKHSRGDVFQLCAGLGAPNAYLTGVFSWECSNGYLAVQSAVDLLAAGRAERVLVVTADACGEGESRILPPNLSVLSDGACSFLVSRERAPGAFEVGSLGFATDGAMTGLWQSDSDEALQQIFEGTAEGIKKASSAALGALKLSPGDMAHLFVHNYNASIMSTFALQLGFDAKKAHSANLARFAHCFAADDFINLADLDAAGGIRAGQHSLLVMTGPTAWGALVLAKC